MPLSPETLVFAVRALVRVGVLGLGKGLEQPGRRGGLRVDEAHELHLAALG